ncbi:hypothetical protein DFP72DRAFT_1001102 [Ephemerocybe angulata]|uniref:Galactose oxidase n=1 Tax=Ephemerocybe angulata TaxID=980116 RepID=A0A8H6IBS6_9AGAR|nr:hypothetical protein DFP72DRAFT_1001102 [Tulosesus angulatus]
MKPSLVLVCLLSHVAVSLSSGSSTLRDYHSGSPSIKGAAADKAVVKERWTTLPPIALGPRQEHVTLALNTSYLGVLGGITPFTTTNNTTSFNTTGLLQLYSLHTRKWLTASPAPEALNHPNAAVIRGEVYLLGGLYDRQDGSYPGSPRSYVYDPATDKWTSLPNLPESDTARGSAAMGVYKDIIYLAGGMSLLPLDPKFGVQQSVDTVSAFNTTSGQWITLPEEARTLPGRRDHAGAAVHNGVFYVLGGRDRGQVNVRGDVFALDLNHLEEGWVVKKGKMPTPRGGISAALVKGKVYTFGGEGNPAPGSDGVFDQVEAYDVAEDSWTKLEKMKSPRHGTSAVAIRDSIYIPGGGVKQGGAPVDTFDAFSP